MTAHEAWLFPELMPEEDDFHQVIRPLDYVFPSDNDLEIPTLRSDMQASALVAPVTRWGSVSRKESRNVGSWHFYTDDYRFEQIWTSPGDLVATGASVAIEPNFSALDDMPFAYGIQQIYKKRWVARWWQDQGIRIVADTFVGDKYWDLNFLGLPADWRSFGLRGQTNDPDLAIDVYKELKKWACGEDILFYVYSGGRAQIEALRKARIPCLVSDYYRRPGEIAKWLGNATNFEGLRVI